MEILKNIFVSREIAQKLKEIGFIENCIAFYDLDGNLSTIIKKQEALLDEYVKGTFTVSNYAGIACPSYEQVFQWFIDRELVGQVLYNFGTYYGFIEFVGECDVVATDDYNSYKEAQERLILELIDIYQRKTVSLQKNEKLWAQQPKKQRKPQG